MGSFNVACSISNLSINSGDKAYFIPLMPNTFSDRIGKNLDMDFGDDCDMGAIVAVAKTKDTDAITKLLENRKAQRRQSPHLVGTSTMLIYANCFFNPLCLPIEGVYNDYGTLDTIVENANVKALEKFFGTSMEKILNCVATGREWCCYMSGVHEAYAEHPELLSSHEFRFGEKFLTKHGFKKIKGSDSFELPKFPGILVNLKPSKRKGEEHGFSISSHGTKHFESLDEEYDSKRILLRKFHDLTGYYLGIPEKFHKAIDIIQNVSGMFVLKDVYDALAQTERPNKPYSDRSGTIYGHYLTQFVLEDLGFKLEKKAKSLRYPERDAIIYSKEGSDAKVYFEELGSEISKGKERSESIFNTGAFGTAWEKMTGDKLDLSKYKKMYQIDILYDSYRAELLASDKMENTNDALFKLQRYSRNYRGGFCRHFEDWEYFSDLYEPLIKKGKLKEEFRWYTLFARSMYSNNRFFFPAMNGEQCGNDEESKILLEASMKVIDSRLKEREDEYSDDQENDEADL